MATEQPPASRAELSSHDTVLVRLNEEVGEIVSSVCQRTGQKPEQLINSVLRSHFGFAQLSSQSGSAAADYGSRLLLAEETLEAIADAVITADPQGTIEYLNPGATELTGWQLEEVLGQHVDTALRVIPEGSDEPGRDLVQECMQAGDLVELEDACFLEDRSGRRVAVDGLATPLRNESGNIIGVAIVIRDVTARRRAEEALREQRNNLEMLVDKRTADLKSLQQEIVMKERLATLGRLTASVSHELRNPLATIRNSMHVIQRKVDGQVDGVERAFARVDRGIVRCNRIVSELLDYTRGTRLSREPLVLDEWLTEVLGELDSPSRVAVVCELAGSVTLSIDGERMRRAIVNVFDNACQAMEEDERTLERELTITTRSRNGRAEIAFRDNGPGMTPEVHKRVFEALYSTKRFGVGLGLPIVKQIMEQHAGGVDIVSVPGESTEVVLWLPLASKGHAHTDDGSA